MREIVDKQASFFHTIKSKKNRFLVAKRLEKAVFCKYNFPLYACVDLEALDLAQGVLRKFGAADAEKIDLPIGDGGAVVRVRYAAEVRVQVLVGEGEEFLGRVDLRHDGVTGRIVLSDALVHDDLRDAALGAEKRLDLLGVDVLSVREDDEILRPAREDEPARLVEASDVPRAEVALRVEGVGGLLRHPVITEHDVLALDADFPVALGIGVGDLQGKTGERKADGARGIELIAIAGDERGALGDAVAVDDIDAVVVKGPDKLGAEGRAARNDDAEVPSEGGEDLSEQKGAEVDMKLPQKGRDPPRAADDAGELLSLDDGADLRVEGLDVEGDENEKIGTLDLHLPRDIAKPRGHIDVHSARKGGKEADGHAVGMVRGEGHDRLSVREDQAPSRECVGQHSALREHDALSLPRRARGEGDERHGKGIGRVGKIETAPRAIFFLDQRGDASLSFLLHKELLHIDAPELLFKLRVEKGVGACRRGDRSVQLLRAPFAVEGDHDGADALDREEEAHPIVGRRADDGDMRALHSFFTERAGERGDVLAEGAVGDANGVLIGRRLAIGDRRGGLIAGRKGADKGRNVVRGGQVVVFGISVRKFLHDFSPWGNAWLRECRGMCEAPFSFVGGHRSIAERAAIGAIRDPSRKAPRRHPRRGAKAPRARRIRKGCSG